MGTHNFRTFFASAAVTAMVLSVPVSAKAKKGSITKVAVTNLPSSTLTLKKGKKKTLKFKVTKKGTISKALAYKTSNKKVVTVSKKGVVTAKKKGKATVTAYAKANKKKKVSIKVIVGTPVSKIKLNKTKATLKVGKTVSLKATVSPKGASYKKVLWKTSNKKIATVSSTGKVKAVKKGSATITATAADGSGKKATAKITVKAATKATPQKPATPAVVPTTVASLQVTNPRTVTFALSKAQALTVDAIKLEVKTTEDANYRTTLKVKSMTTTDNVNYTVLLKEASAIGNDSADHNVRLTVTGLENNTAPVTIETLFRKGKIDKTFASTKLFKKGERLSNEQVSTYTTQADTYVTSTLPAGLKQNTERDGVVIYGTPTSTDNQDITVKETDVYGNTYTQVTHLKFYDDDTVNGYVDYNNSYDQGYVTPGIDTKNTPDIADDTLATTVEATINVSGGQTYEPQHEEQTGKTVTDYDNILGYKEEVIVKKKVDQKDSNDSYYYDDGDGYATVYGDEAKAAYKTDKSGNKIAKTADGKTVYAQDEYGRNVYDADGKQLPVYELNDGYKVVYRRTYYSNEEVYGTKPETKTVDAKEVDYQFLSGDSSGLKLDPNGTSCKISGSIGGTRTVVVRATRKNKAGSYIHVDIPVTFNVADAKLVKGTITDSNGKAVQNAKVTATNNDLNTNYSSPLYTYQFVYDYDYTYNTNKNGQYEYVLLNGTNYDVTVSRGNCDNFYAAQATADTMNYKLDGVQYDVNMSDPDHLGYNLAYSTLYDDATNDAYTLADNYDEATYTHHYNLFTDKPVLTVNSDSSDYNATINVVNGSASGSITKK
ncbi:MAG: Ig-like domain-containing protein [Intestinibaculum porci]|uniref:Ig-like domain-containing protein n=1 Tax=Intestinibaculum porci TaxID=2487118 RepID=UPI00240A7736|nr:Ig-like domain-containing protein [Intestinibaculum porci]MDD6421592.1 Ig-like domain-containing protein [Intestinibaculum porci]